MGLPLRRTHVRSVSYAAVGNRFNRNGYYLGVVAMKLHRFAICYQEVDSWNSVLNTFT